MRRAIVSRQCISIEDVPIPSLVGPEDVLVKVHAVGLTPFDVGVTYDLSRFVSSSRMKNGLGSTFAGEILQIGSSVTQLAVSDAVVGMVPNPLTQCTLQEYIVVPAGVCARRPSNFSPSEAASVLCDAMIGERALRLAKACDTDAILITGGASPLARMIIEIAKSSMFGVEWIATTVNSLEDRQYAESVGADETFDTTTNGGAWSSVFESGINQKSYDIVIDITDDSKRAKRLLNRTSGRLLSLRNKITCAELLDFFERNEDKKFLRSNIFLNSKFFGPIFTRSSGRTNFANGRYFTVLPSGDGEILERLCILMETGAISPRIEETVSFDAESVTSTVARIKTQPFSHKGRFVVRLLS